MLNGSIPQSFSPDSLNGIQHEIAKLTVRGRDYEARTLHQTAVALVESWLADALDPQEAFSIMHARAAARARLELILSEAIFEPFDPPAEPQPDPQPPYGPSRPYPCEVR